MFPVLRRGALLLLAPLAASPVMSQERYEGQAYPLGGGPLLYREVHLLYRDNGVRARLVMYRCPDGRAFARKQLRERPSATAPDFDFIDGRTGYREGVRKRAGTLEVYWQEHASAPMRRQPLEAPAGTVIDAGFDAFVRTHWAGLTAGNSAIVPFLIPSRLGTLDFRIADAGRATEDGRRVQHLKMRLAGMFGLVLPEIELTYDVPDHRLRRFVGMGTIRDGRGRNQSVRIEFSAAPEPNGATPEAIASALRDPLAGRCMN